VPLLFLLLVGATVAAPSTPESLYRKIKAAGDKGDTRAVLALSHEALTRFPDGDDEWTWRIRCVRSRALVNDGKAEEAIAILQRPLPAALRETEVDLLRLESQAWAWSKSKDSAPAEPLIRQAYALAKEKHPRKLAGILVLRMIIDSPNAMKWGSEAIVALRKYPDPAMELSTRGQTGVHYARAGRFDEAIDIWEPALVEARKRGNEASLEKLEGNLGWAYMELGDYERASELFESAYKTALRIGQRTDAVPWTYQLGTVRLQKGDLAGAEKYYRAADRLARETKHEQLPGILNLLAAYELRVGRLSEARRDADEALRVAKERKRPDDELQALLISGRIAASEARYTEAENLLKDVVARSKLKSVTSEARLRLAQLHSNRGNFSAAEQQFRQAVAVARQLREEIGSKELRFSFFNVVEELFDSYVDFLMARGRVEDALSVTESSRAQTLEEALSDLVAPRDVRSIARATRATILCYWLGKTQSYLWIVTPEKIDYVKLPSKRAIETAIDAYQGSLLGSHGTISGSGARGEALWRMLVQPAARSIAPGSRLIIVPHGRLSAFNMETLVVPVPAPHYWIKDAVIGTAGSLGLLVRKAVEPNAERRLLLIGDTPPPTAEFAPLPHARKELNKVARHFDRTRSVILSGIKATPSAYLSAQPERFTFLHFVAHGVPVQRTPLDSAVVLAREGETFKLYARDIARHPLNAKLVTISSCHGAGTRTYAGEGLIGLGWAFLHAGADNVVAALWEVDDRATADLMDVFYGSLATGVDPASALRDAKLELIRKGGIFAKPRYWAPFLLYGSS
jgi:tetratricopeptide (TPR) repeat protein